jgi:hypothetical protein
LGWPWVVFGDRLLRRSHDRDWARINTDVYRTALENVPVAARGICSGILQQGYSFGYLLAAVINLGKLFVAVSSSRAELTP